MQDQLFPNAAAGDPATLYLDLIKRCLVNWVYADTEVLFGGAFDARLRGEGQDWPPTAHTMIGLRRLDNLQHCAEAVLRDRVPGDFLEAGVWRGGAAILMRAVLKAHGATDRLVWLADSFAGLPPPNPDKYPHDAGLDLSVYPQLAVSADQVRANIARYGLLDGQVRFLPGWFRDTLPAAPVGRLAVLRLDGDLYESTTDALTHLYPKLSPGGFVLVDDYGAIAACRQAVHDYRDAHGITDPITPVDWTGVYWRRG
jgi:hypothetical protein